MGDAMEYFFDADKPHWTAWCQVQMMDVSWLDFTPDEKYDRAFPLYYASLGGFYDLAEHLVGKHPEHVNARGGLLVTPLVAALRGKHFQVAELLHRHGADVDVRSGSGRTPLREACNGEVLDIVQWLLNHGADMNTTHNDGLWAPLHTAASRGRLQVCQMLIKRNADTDIRTDLGKSPLHLAASPEVKGHLVDIMQVLLDHGANPDARDDDNSTPLHHSSWWHKQSYAFRWGTVEGTRLLLKHGAIIDAKDDEGRTPLQLAMEHGRHDIVICLKEHGATR
jgi:ankyrin repeat protein